VRDRSWPEARRRALAQRLRDLAAPFDATLLYNGDEAVARELGLAGVHWTAAQLAAAPARPRGLLLGASCHDASDLARAAALGADFVVLGPVRATPTHPAATPLGLARFASLVHGASVPVYALGGMTNGYLDAAIDSGAHGVAMRRGAWPAA